MNPSRRFWVATAVHSAFRPVREPPQAERVDASIEHLDNIIVGAGSAGAPLAARLSEDPARRIRGMPGDYDQWAATGNPEWAWSKTLSQFQALEDDLDFGGEFHGRGGPVPIRRWRPDELTPVQQSFLEACPAAGFPDADDHNHPESTGVGTIPSNCKDASVRVSTATTYLTEARARRNLTILADTLVNRVLLHEGKVRGVELTTGSTRQELRACRMILAAVAVCSPAILMRSGIGPGDDLGRLGLDVHACLPGVGAGLIDQPRIGVLMVPKPGAENYGKSTGHIVLRTSAVGSEQLNDMYYAMVNHFDLTDHFPQFRQFAGARRVLGVMAVARRPRSRGRITLNSTDPHVASHVDLNYLSEENDYQLLADGVRACWNSLIRRRSVIRVRTWSCWTTQSSIPMKRYETTSKAAWTARTTQWARPGWARATIPEWSSTSGAQYTESTACTSPTHPVLPAMVRANTNLSVVMIGERVTAMPRNA